jgi:hypothetical protein
MPAYFGRVAVWLLASVSAILLQRAVYEHYLLTMVPPLALGAALFLVEFHRRVAWFRRRMLLWGVAFGVASVPFAWVTILDQWPRGDRDTAAITEHLDRLGLSRGTGAAELYVVDHEASLYLLTGTTPQSRYAYPGHLQCDYGLPRGVDAEAEIDRVMAQQPRFVVITERRSRLTCTQPDRMARFDQHIAAGYVLVARAGTPGDAVEIYRRRTPGS